MTADEFRAWQQSLSLTNARAAEILDLSPRMILYYRNGKKPVPKALELACHAISAMSLIPIKAEYREKR